jgi:hypothetical protein
MYHSPHPPDTSPAPYGISFGKASSSTVCHWLPCTRLSGGAETSNVVAVAICLQPPLVLLLHPARSEMSWIQAHFRQLSQHMRQLKRYRQLTKQQQEGQPPLAQMFLVLIRRQLRQLQLQLQGIVTTMQAAVRAVNMISHCHQECMQVGNMQSTAMCEPMWCLCLVSSVPCLPTTAGRHQHVSISIRWC